MTEYLLVLTTCPEADAARIARTLVESGLAACVTRQPAHSTFRWRGAVQEEPEMLLSIKTLGEHYPDLERRLKAIHPYDVPEIIALPVAAGSEAYLSWLKAAVTA